MLYLFECCEIKALTFSFHLPHFIWLWTRTIIFCWFIQGTNKKKISAMLRSLLSSFVLLLTTFEGNTKQRSHVFDSIYVRNIIHICYKPNICWHLEIHKLACSSKIIVVYALVIFMTSCVRSICLFFLQRRKYIVFRFQQWSHWMSFAGKYDFCWHILEKLKKKKKKKAFYYYFRLEISTYRNLLNKL